MAIQIVCFHCGRQFLMTSANMECKAIELTIAERIARKAEVRIVCRHCGKENFESLAPVIPRGHALSPTEYRENKSEKEAQQRTEDFHKDYLLVGGSGG